MCSLGCALGPRADNDIGGAASRDTLRAGADNGQYGVLRFPPYIYTQVDVNNASASARPLNLCAARGECLLFFCWRVRVCVCGS